MVGPSLGGRQPRVTNVEKLSLNFLAPAACTSHVVVDPPALARPAFPDPENIYKRPQRVT